MEHAGWITATVFAVDWMIRIGLSLRVVMRRPQVGVALAWIAVILSFPFAGALIYVLIGEPRLGRERAGRATAVHRPYREWLGGLRSRYDTSGPAAEDGSAGLARMIESVLGPPPLAGNELTLHTDAESFFRALIADVDAARRTCHLEFYIWSDGGLADELAEALLRASARGVVCRVLVDALGSKAFLKGPTAERLRRGGVRLRVALPVGLGRALTVRFDLRLHRKIVVLDGEVAYTGSQNVADPRFFKQGAGVGRWVDAMARLRGPAVEALGVTFLEDWEMETGEGLQALADGHDLHTLPAAGHSSVQVAPTGPNLPPSLAQAILLEAIYSARRELVLTTPYFVPDESLLIALASASSRGVEVTLVVPARNDSRLVDLASRAFQGDLAASGVRIRLFDGGLLHTKSITVDGRWGLFGSLNLDPRSLRLNFEITLAVYDPSFTGSLRGLQQSYIDDSRPLDLAAWRARAPLTKLAENAARLVGPLL
jgi:cardiolipin synthase